MSARVRRAIEASLQAFNKRRPSRPGMVRVRMTDGRACHARCNRPARSRPCTVAPRTGRRCSTNECFDWRLVRAGLSGNCVVIVGANESVDRAPIRRARNEALRLSYVRRRRRRGRLTFSRSSNGRDETIDSISGGSRQRVFIGEEPDRTPRSGSAKVGLRRVHAHPAGDRREGELVLGRSGALFEQ